jgi:hypothetical protein
LPEGARPSQLNAVFDAQAEETMRTSTATVMGLVVLGAACRHASMDGFTPKVLGSKEQARVESAPLGSAQNPVRCEQPKGERAYLQRLRCPSGTAPTFARSGSTGAGPYGTILDEYEVRCPDRTQASTAFMDMYHTGFIERRPVSGFSIQEP